MSDDHDEFLALCALLQDPTRDAELQRFTLPPESHAASRYQHASWRVGDLHDEVTRQIQRSLGPRRAEDYPTLIYVISRCRNGTNALLRLFGAAGVLAACQPFKNSLRHAMVGARYAWRFPPPERARVLFAKTTFGPLTRAESVFDPIRCLLAAGYPADKLTLIFLDRDPRVSLLSWRSTWRNKQTAAALTQNFVLSSLNVRRAERLAPERGIAALHYYVYEANAARERAVPRLFERLGLGERYDASVLERWPPRGDPRSGVSTDPEPEPFRTPRSVSQHDSFDYFPREPSGLDERSRELLDEWGILDDYRRTRERTRATLGLLDDLSVARGREQPTP